MKCHSRGEQKRGYFSLDPQILLITVPSLRWFWVHLRKLPSTERGIGGCPRPCLQLEKCMSGVMLDQASHLPLGPRSWNSLLFPATFATAAVGSNSSLTGVGSALEEGDSAGPWSQLRPQGWLSLWAEPELLYLSCPSQSTALGVNSRLLQQERVLLKATPVRPQSPVCTQGGAQSLAAGRSGIGVWPSYRAGCLGIPAALVSPGPGSWEYVLGCGERRLLAFQWQWRNGACIQLLSENQVLDVIAAFWVWPRCPFLSGAGTLDQRARLVEKLIRGQSWSLCTCVGISHLVFIYFFFSFLLVVGCQLTNVPRISFFYGISNSWILFLSPRWSICEAKQCAHGHTVGEWSLDLSPAVFHARAHPSQKYLGVCVLGEILRSVCAYCLLFHFLLGPDPIAFCSLTCDFHLFEVIPGVTIVLTSGETDAHLWWQVSFPRWLGE